MTLCLAERDTVTAVPLADFHGVLNGHVISGVGRRGLLLHGVSCR